MDKIYPDYQKGHSNYSAVKFLNYAFYSYSYSVKEMTKS